MLNAKQAEVPAVRDISIDRLVGTFEEWHNHFMIGNNYRRMNQKKWSDSKHGDRLREKARTS